LKTKDQVLSVLKKFQVSFERETEKKIKCLRTDNEGEYIGPFDAYCKEQGIRHHFTPPKTPHLDGLAERMNMTTVERVRCLLSSSKLLKHYWGDALYFRGGWPQFAEDHELLFPRVFFMLFDYHCGTSKFDVKIFDCTQCQRKYEAEVHFQ
jgi:transposase InsO family protein